jgi:hypothetical protein
MSSPGADSDWRSWRFLYDPGVWSIIDENTRIQLNMLENALELPKNGVCHICQKTFSDWSILLPHCDFTLEWIELDFSSHPSLLSCKATANKGCKICSMLLRGRNDLNDRDDDEDEARELYRTLEIIDEPMTVKFTWSQMHGTKYWELGFSSSKLVYECFFFNSGNTLTFSLIGAASC